MDALEQEATESSCPDKDEPGHDERRCFVVRAQDQRQDGDRYIGQAAGQIEVLLRLVDERVDEHQPVHTERSQDAPHHRGHARLFHAVGADQPGNQCCDHRTDNRCKNRNLISTHAPV